MYHQKINEFFPRHYAEEKVVVEFPAMRDFNARGYGKDYVKIIIDALYQNKDFQEYIESREQSCKAQITTNSGPGKDSLALYLEELKLVLHGVIYIIEANGNKGDAFEVDFIGLDKPQRIKGIIPKKIKLH